LGHPQKVLQELIPRALEKMKVQETLDFGFLKDRHNSNKTTPNYKITFHLIYIYIMSDNTQTKITITVFDVDYKMKDCEHGYRFDDAYTKVDRILHPGGIVQVEVDASCHMKHYHIGKVPFIDVLHHCDVVESFIIDGSVNALKTIRALLDLGFIVLGGHGSPIQKSHISDY
jgi:hypothetical protein